MELRHLRYFVAVAEELNFTRAAARLHTSQPSLSQQIRQLETAIGISLLDRSRHHVALTDGGRIFLREVRDILGRIDHAGRLAKQAADGRAGELSVGTFPAADVRILPPLRAAVATQLPDLRLLLHSKYAVEPAMLNSCWIDGSRGEKPRFESCSANIATNVTPKGRIQRLGATTAAVVVIPAPGYRERR